MIFQNAWASVRGELEEAGIWYMPLKGALLKELYPKYGMREFCDHDILFDASRAEDVRAIMEGLGFTTEHFGKGKFIAEFEERNRSLALRLFGDGELTDADMGMLGYVLSSGTYGTCTNLVSNALRRNDWTKLRYMMHRFAVPVSRKNRECVAFAKQYPLFYEHKVLLPALPLHRVFRSAREGRLFGEAKAVRRAKNGAAPE